MGTYRSAKELRAILDQVLSEIEADPVDCPRLRGAGAPVRLEITDLKLVLNMAPGEGGGKALDWDFSATSHRRPKLSLKMDSEFANRFLQGRENPAIAIVRGRLRTSSEDIAAALRFFPAVRPLFEHYRELVVREYSHLALD
jgi:hypothetical protein